MTKKNSIKRTNSRTQQYSSNRANKAQKRAKVVKSGEKAAKLKGTKKGAKKPKRRESKLSKAINAKVAQAANTLLSIPDPCRSRPIGTNAFADAFKLGRKPMGGLYFSSPNKENQSDAKGVQLGTTSNVDSAGNKLNATFGSVKWANAEIAPNLSGGMFDQWLTSPSTISKIAEGLMENSTYVRYFIDTITKTVNKQLMAGGAIRAGSIEQTDSSNVSSTSPMVQEILPEQENEVVRVLTQRVVEQVADKLKVGGAIRANEPTAASPSSAQAAVDRAAVVERAKDIITEEAIEQRREIFRQLGIGSGYVNDGVLSLHFTHKETNSTTGQENVYEYSIEVTVDDLLTFDLVSSLVSDSWLKNAMG
jgi:hypothetical protein